MEILNTQFPQDDKKFSTITKIKDILFPKRCLFCFEEGTHLCKNHRNFSAFTGKPKSLPSLDKIIIACNYDANEANRVIHAYKFEGAQEFAKIMANTMLSTLQKEKSQEFFSEFVLVPVPLHWTRRLWRGFNQSELLAKKLQNLLQIPIKKNLKRIRRTKQQARLSKKERLDNLENAFVWDDQEAFLKKFLGFFPSSSPRRRGSTSLRKEDQKIPEKILLIDDVCTTGSTLEAAAQTLRKAGAKEVIGIVFAGGS